MAVKFFTVHQLSCSGGPTSRRLSVAGYHYWRPAILCCVCDRHRLSGPRDELSGRRWRPTDRPTLDLAGDQVRQIAVQSCCYYLRAPETTSSSLLSGEGKHRERTLWRMRDSLKKFEAVAAVVLFRSWRTLRFLGEIGGRSGCFSSFSYPPRSFLLKKERKKEKNLLCLLLSSLLACMGEVTWMLHQALFQSQFHWRYLWILSSTRGWSFLVYIEGMLSSTNTFPSRKGQVFGYFKMPAYVSFSPYDTHQHIMKKSIFASVLFQVMPFN